tara:strand:- start:5208 stop:5546 length:339 start_codon:yes stop_codon:yes gene_type:complete
MKKLYQQIARYAVKACPNEVCGVVKNSKAIRCENKANETNQAFLIDAETYLKYLPDTIFHSHPTGMSGFSEHDLAVAANMELTSYVYVVEADRLEKWTAAKGVEVFEKVLGQ